jgi:chromosome segregation ATPase
LRASLEGSQSVAVQEAEAAFRRREGELEAHYQQVLTQTRHEWELRLSQVSAQLAQAEASVQAVRHEETAVRSVEVTRLHEQLRSEQERRAAAETLVIQLRESGNHMQGETASLLGNIERLSQENAQLAASVASLTSELELAKKQVKSSNKELQKERKAHEDDVVKYAEDTEKIVGSLRAELERVRSENAREVSRVEAAVRDEMSETLR